MKMLSINIINIVKDLVWIIVVEHSKRTDNCYRRGGGGVGVTLPSVNKQANR